MDLRNDPEKLARVLTRLARDLQDKAAVAERTEGLERAAVHLLSDADDLRAAASLLRGWARDTLLAGAAQ